MIVKALKRPVTAPAAPVLPAVKASTMPVAAPTGLSTATRLSATGLSAAAWLSTGGISTAGLPATTDDTKACATGGRTVINQARNRLRAGHSPLALERRAAVSRGSPATEKSPPECRILP